MRKNETTRLAAAPVVRSCRACDWQVWSDSAVVAELEQATHRVTDHATLPERVRIRELVSAYRELLGDLPEHLLVLAVHHVLDGPARSPLALTAEIPGQGAAA
jgi:hypothetical protein